MKKRKKIAIKLPFKLEESSWNAETVARMEKEYVRELACHLALINANSISISVKVPHILIILYEIANFCC